jgi:hypothetical protein
MPRLRTMLAGAVLLGSLAFLAYKTYASWNELQSYEWQIQPVHLPLIFLACLLQTLAVTRGWQSIMNFVADVLPFRQHLKILGYTNLMRRVPAGWLWSTAGRLHAYRNQNVSARRSALGSVLELMVALLTALPLAAIALAELDLLPRSTGLPLALAAVAIEIAALHPALLTRLVKLARQEIVVASLGYRDTLNWAAYYTLMWLASSAAFYLITRLFIPLPLSRLPDIASVWVLSTLIAQLTMFSPGGLGIKEMSLTVMLEPLLPPPLPLLIALATRLILTVYDLLIGALASRL